MEYIRNRLKPQQLLTLELMKLRARRRRRPGAINTMILTKVGTGAGVATITITVSTNLVISLSANAKFYSDGAGTLNESSTYTFTTGGARTRYIKCTTGVATMHIPFPKYITNWGAWTSGANAPGLSGDVAKLVFATNINMTGANTMWGKLGALTSLATINVTGTSVIAGDVFGIIVGLTSCILNPCGITEYSKAGTTAWEDATITIMPAVGYGLSATEVDNMLIDMAASDSFSGKTITLTGSNAARTAASNTAVTKLETIDSGYVHAANTIITT